MSSSLGRLFGAIWHLIYGIYAWLMFVLTVLATILIATIVPGLDRRRRWISLATRAFFASVGIRTTITGAENIPAGHCVVVANHASYIDGVILQAYLPPRFSFVIKGEVRNFPVAHFVLRRLGSKFVERFSAAGSARDARTIVKAAASGESLAFFPEGTFIDQPGLSRFRAGAFVAASKGDLPVVPLAIRGSRAILGSGEFLPRRHDLQIDALPPIYPGSEYWASTATIAEESRQRILSVLGEPDLLSEVKPSRD